MRDRIGCNCRCGRRRYRAVVATADGASVRDDREAAPVAVSGADAEAEGDVGTLDGSVVGIGVRLGTRGSTGDLGIAVGLGDLAADWAGAGVGVGLLLAGVGRAGPWGS